MANSFRSLIKSGFGLGLGLYLAQILIALIGLAFFIPGYALYTKEKKETASSSTKILPLVLMGIGVAILGGAGLGLLADASGDLFG